MNVRYRSTLQYADEADIEVSTYNGTLTFKQGEAEVEGRIPSFLNREEQVADEWAMNSHRNFRITGNSLVTSAFRVLPE